MLLNAGCLCTFYSFLPIHLGAIAEKITRWAVEMGPRGPIRALWDARLHCNCTPTAFQLHFNRIQPHFNCISTALQHSGPFLVKAARTPPPPLPHRSSPPPSPAPPFPDCHAEQQL